MDPSRGAEEIQGSSRGAEDHGSSSWERNHLAGHDWHVTITARRAIEARCLFPNELLFEGGGKRN